MLSIAVCPLLKIRPDYVDAQQNLKELLALVEPEAKKSSKKSQPLKNK
ncbi:MAG: hypothetical protein RIR39_1360 [Pseudomonadota bacterium]|jgi:hypothetical protein